MSQQTLAKSKYTGDPMQTVRDRMDGMPAESWAMLQNCPSVHHMMSGIQLAGFNGVGVVRVKYEDGEDRELQMPDWFKDIELEKLTLLTFASVFTP